MGLFIHSMNMLSRCYSELNLHYAARYYAIGALYISINSNDEDARQLSAAAAFGVADSLFSAGESLSYMMMLRLAIFCHFDVAEDPANLSKHPILEQAVARVCVIKVSMDLLSPEISKVCEILQSKLPINWSDKAGPEFIGSIQERAVQIQKMEQKINTELGASLFCDVGPSKVMSWSALGIHWTVLSLNDPQSEAVSVEFVTVMQIMAVELTRFELLLIPCSVDINIEIDDLQKPSIAFSGSNEVPSWRIKVPREWETKNHEQEQSIAIMAIAVEIITSISAANETKIKQVLLEAFKDGLFERTYSVRPCRELVTFSQSFLDDEIDIRSLESPTPSISYVPREADALKWNSSKGPGYSKRRANEFLNNRYKRARAGIALSLPRVLADDRIKGLLSGLRVEGYLDWQILAIIFSIVCNQQIDSAMASLSQDSMAKSMNDRAGRAELASDPPIDLAMINPEMIDMQKKIMLVAVFKTWGLELRLAIPPFDGLKKLLDERYFHSRDDIPHEPLAI